MTFSHGNYLRRWYTCMLYFWDSGFREVSK